MSPYDVITISREFGAGGSELAAALGARLGWPVVDRDLVTRVAARLGVDADDVALRDEHAPGLLERIGTTILRTAPEVLVVPPDADLPSPERIAAAVRHELNEAIHAPPVIVVGHGTQALLGQRPNTLHVRLVAPIAERIDRICGRAGCTPREAADLAHRVDADRVSYVRTYYHIDVRDPLHYALVLNTGSMSMADAVECITAALEPAHG